MIVSTLLIIFVLITSWMAAVYKVKEVQLKEYFRKRHENNFSFLSNKGYMQTLFFCMVSPAFFLVSWTKEMFIVVIVLSFVRFIPWVMVANAKGAYKNTTHQISSNFTMLENFAGPLGALLLYSLHDYMTSSSISIVWYFLTPIMGFFLLWALRDREKPLSREMFYIVMMQSILVASETGILLYLEDIQINISLTYHLLPFFNQTMYLFLMVVATSSLWIGMYYVKDIISEIKLGAGRDAFMIGFLSAIHDLIYFVGFALFGPIFIIARRGMIIPMQNLYLGLIESKRIVHLLKKPFHIPLLELKGGKDFIISFVDLVFNRIINIIISLLHQ